MTEYRIIYWRDIPAQIKLRDEEGRASKPLSRRFSAAISAASLQAGLTASDDYLAMWRNSEWTAVSGTLEEAAAALLSGLEAAYPPPRLRALVRAGGLESTEEEE
jgi:hypothetical protein